MSPAAVSEVATAVLLGLCLGAGACLLLSVGSRVGAVSLTRRIAPYVRDVGDPRGIAANRIAPGDWRAAVREARSLVTAKWAALLGGSAPIARRLAQAGWRMDVTAFRGRELAWAVVGLLFGGIVALGVALTGRASPVLIVLAPVCAIAAIGLCDAVLARAARHRSARIEEELPTVLEFLALCLTAGETVMDAVRRVAGLGAGELSAELRAVAVAVDTGASLPDALRQLADRVQLAPLTRTIDHLVAALDRGAPLAHVLHAQAGDSRAEAKRAMIEQAGRKEILMLLPLVFLILPLSVVFAVYPGVFMLRLGIG